MGAKAEILYEPKGPDWLTPKQFRTAALATAIITGIISGGLALYITQEPATPAHINTVEEPAK